MKLLPSVATLIISVSSTLFAGVEKQEDGTFIITGPLSYLAERNNIFLAAGFDKGDYKNILLKEAIITAAPALKSCKKTEVSLKVQGKELTDAAGLKVLIAERLVDVISGPSSSETPATPKAPAAPATPSTDAPEAP